MSQPLLTCFGFAKTFDAKTEKSPFTLANPFSLCYNIYNYIAP